MIVEEQSGGASVPSRKNVTVTVSGLTGSGKSAIYGEIVTALRAIGVPLEHANEKAWRSECHMTHADWLSALEMYQPTVTMAEQNIPRQAKGAPTRSAKTTKIGLVRRMVARCRQAFAQPHPPKDHPMTSPDAQAMLKASIVLLLMDDNAPHAASIDEHSANWLANRIMAYIEATIPAQPSSVATDAMIEAGVRELQGHFDSEEACVAEIYLAMHERASASVATDGEVERLRETLKKIAALQPLKTGNELARYRRDIARAAIAAQVTK